MREEYQQIKDAIGPTVDQHREVWRKAFTGNPEQGIIPLEADERKGMLLVVNAWIENAGRNNVSSAVEAGQRNFVLGRLFGLLDVLNAESSNVNLNALSFVESRIERAALNIRNSNSETSEKDLELLAGLGNKLIKKMEVVASGKTNIVSETPTLDGVSAPAAPTTV